MIISKVKVLLFLRLRDQINYIDFLSIKIFRSQIKSHEVVLIQ
jgi:hypothetical protein